MITGGVAKNGAVVRALNEKLNTTIIVPPEPQIAGALGAAILAQEEFDKLL
ncbi:MAG: BadF/BadG/BcrA/BcrD ATPase family protein [Dethiobacteria bacterium]